MIRTIAIATRSSSVLIAAAIPLALLTATLASAQDYSDPAIIALEAQVGTAIKAANTFDDYAKIRPLLDKGAGAGLRQALVVVGLGYSEGWFGYPKDQAHALELLSRAALLQARAGDGSDPYTLLIGIAAAQKDHAKEWEWRAAGAAAGMPTHQYVYAMAAADGLNGVARNETLAVTMMKQAALGGHDEAMIRLGIWLEDGKYGLAVDHDAARHWYLKAQYTPAGLDADVKNMINRMDGKPQSWGSYAQPYLPESERKPENRLAPQSRSVSSAETEACNKWWMATWGPGGSARTRTVTQSAWPSWGTNSRTSAERDQADHEARMNKFYSDWDKEMNRNGH